MIRQARANRNHSSNLVMSRLRAAFFGYGGGCTPLLLTYPSILRSSQLKSGSVEDAPEWARRLPSGTAVARLRRVLPAYGGGSVAAAVERRRWCRIRRTEQHWREFEG